jgi:hypothetical protein
VLIQGLAEPLGIANLGASTLLHLELNLKTNIGEFPLIPTFSITCRGGARYLAIAQNSFRILSHHDDNGNVLNQSSMDIDLFNTNLPDEI